MQQRAMKRGKRSMPRRWRLVIVGAMGLSALLLAGVLTVRGSGERVESTQPVSRPVPQVSEPSVQPAGQQQAAMSPRAEKQYRAFYAQQMALEAALERWSGPAPALATPQATERAPRVTAGMQFE